MEEAVSIASAASEWRSKHLTALNVFYDYKVEMSFAPIASLRVPRELQERTILFVNR